MELSVYKIDGSESGKKVVLPENAFGVTPNDHAIYLDVVQYLANQRQVLPRPRTAAKLHTAPRSSVVRRVAAALVTVA